MINIAILGYGVVGKGVARLIAENGAEVASVGGDGVNVKYILDLRDFPGDPLAERVVHDFALILRDESVRCVIELMGGSHPAYEYTLAALRAGKHVISSNKEVVASFGDEFLRVASASGVTYRFEAAVGGGIPVISPLIGMIKQNKISEVRGILNGTSNYILTRMFKFGDSFSAALESARQLGYAEKNPDADILGLDAARKICILAAIATGTLLPTEQIHTEGITAIRPADVAAMERMGYVVKLVARCLIRGGAAAQVLVAPFAIQNGEPLANVSGVYNAVEITAAPLGNIMLYGQGAGSGATASAVVGDLVQIMRTGVNYPVPAFVKGGASEAFASFSARRYIACPKGSDSAVTRVFGGVGFIGGDECAFLTQELTEAELAAKLAELRALGVEPLSAFRVL